jgi:hypothetical protein
LNIRNKNIEEWQQEHGWQTVLENNFHLLYLEVYSLPIVASSLDITTHRDT